MAQIQEVRELSNAAITNLMKEYPDEGTSSIFNFMNVLNFAQAKTLIWRKKMTKRKKKQKIKYNQKRKERKQNEAKN